MEKAINSEIGPYYEKYANIKYICMEIWAWRDGGYSGSGTWKAHRE
jgi:hypothetical protein